MKFKRRKPCKLSDVDDLQIRQLERLANTWTTATNSCPSAMDNARMLKALAEKLKSRNGD